MGSEDIARRLEGLFPEPQLCTIDDDAVAAQNAVNVVIDGLRLAGISIKEAESLTHAPCGPVCIPRVPTTTLNEVSRPYFYSTRKERFGILLPELARSNLAGEAAWTRADAGLQQIRHLLSKNLAGPFVHGEDVSYADFVLWGFFPFTQYLDEDGGLFGSIMEYDKAFGALFSACRPWAERDSS